LIEKLKKNAEYFPEIDFAKSVALLDTLNQFDNTLFERIVTNAYANKKPKLNSIRIPFAMREEDNSKRSG
jgi:hypothetical protein